MWFTVHSVLFALFVYLLVLATNDIINLKIMLEKT